MKTTLKIDDDVMRRLKAEAARQGVTLSCLVETAFRRYLQTGREKPKLPPLPTFNGGAFLVDISDREALYRAMEEED